MQNYIRLYITLLLLFACFVGYQCIQMMKTFQKTQSTQPLTRMNDAQWYLEKQFASTPSTGTGVVNGDVNSQENCLKLHNEVRSRQGRPPLASGTADEIACANRVAQANYQAGVHKNLCQMAQNECPRFGSLKQCLDAYEKEGPAPGLSHYNNIKNANSSVSCGVYNIGGGSYYYSHQYK